MNPLLPPLKILSISAVSTEGVRFKNGFFVLSIQFGNVQALLALLVVSKNVSIHGTNHTRRALGWLKPIIDNEMKLVDVAKVCPHSPRSLKRWKKAYEKSGMQGLIPKSTEPKTQPNETAIRLKEEVNALRKRTGLCALKLHWRLQKQGLEIPTRTIGKILKDEGLVRKYRVKKMKYKYVRAERQPGKTVIQN